MNIKLNIGLATPLGMLTEARVLAAIAGAGMIASDVHVAQSGTEPTVICTARVIEQCDLYEVIHGLSCILHQDCIAWRQDCGTGHLTGPRAESWGQFNPEFFLE